MTDNEIIEALPTVGYGGHCCMKCKYRVDKGEEKCGIKGCKIARNALDLINRQKTEIERLMPFGCQVEVSKKIEREIKSEVIKELAERLKSLRVLPEFPFDEGYVMESTIDNLAKEMTDKVFRKLQQDDEKP